MADIEPDETLTISPNTVCFIIVKAREFDAKDLLSDVDDATDATDDGTREVLEDDLDDPASAELTAVIDALNEDEQIDLVALAWLGRGEDGADWESIRAEAGRQHNTRVTGYLMGMPLLADYLEEGLSQLGHSCDDAEISRL